MISVSYISKAEKKFSDSELLEMLGGFQKNNEKSNISGVLLYNGAGTFIQIIEGEQEVIDPLYQSIKNDNRHTNVTCLRRAEIQARSFSEWRMGFRKLSNDELIDASKATVFMDDEKLEHFVSDDTDFALKVLTNFKNKTKELIFE
ncbi:BLUF domain-containing protein [Marinomonas sp. C2222]|uniref:BLUF domain-containing protein n=1 Tax=Marinomonas sargassi TaxID=2984494 RepID=A0ABT2YRA8_9GAMM|nr:BLUF domain-containing protein [Marinomonas sargassi]MCV2402424.1 BLUF domain-containing protein [Marinomonas sargassi]